MDGNSDKKSWHRDLQSAVSAALSPDQDKNRSNCDSLENIWSSQRSRLGDLKNDIERMEGEIDRLRSDRNSELRNAAINAAASLAAGAIGRAVAVVRALQRARKLKDLNANEIGKLAASLLPFVAAAENLRNANDANQDMKRVASKLESVKRKADSLEGSIQQTYSDFIASGCNRGPSVGV